MNPQISPSVKPSKMKLVVEQFMASKGQFCRAIRDSETFSAWEKPKGPTVGHSFLWFYHSDS